HPTGIDSDHTHADQHNINMTDTTKTMVVKIDVEFVMIQIRGDHELNDIKDRDYFGTEDAEFATDSEIRDIMKASPGSLGPVGASIPVYLDHQVDMMYNYPAGANNDGYHYINVNHGRDFEVAGTGDFRFITEGEKAEDGSGDVKFMKGIEVGQVFKLGTKYTESMNLNVLNENGRSVPVLMGCYGIGMSRTLSAIIESHHDDRGIIWPKSVTPFDIHIITANPKDRDAEDAAERLYEILSREYRVLYD